jgi:ferritin-like metal-binding protein YciE
MSEALERVIAEQQAQIDRLKQIVDSNNKSFAGFTKSQERMAHAAFGLINEPRSHDRMWALKLELQAQGWCVFCEASPCECDHD